MDNTDSFSYRYSAKEQEEIKAIKNKYVPAEEGEDKLLRLRRLDASVTSKATVTALLFGIVGALVLGFGMSLTMSEFYALLGMSGSTALWVGISVGIVGIVLVGLAYPLYNRIIKKERARIAPEILRLAEELTQ